MKAIVTSSVCPLYGKPTRQSTVEDEALFGMVVELLDAPAPGWQRVRTHYRYEGIVSEEDLLLDDEAAEEWEKLPKKVVRNKNFCDVLSEPKVQGFLLATVPRGGLLRAAGEPEKGWLPVVLPDGRTGFVPEGIMADCPTSPVSGDEDTLRRALVDAGAPTTAGAENPPRASTAPAWYPWPICSAAFSSTGTPTFWRIFPSGKFLWKR